MGSFLQISICIIIMRISNLIAFEISAEALYLSCNDTSSKNHKSPGIVHHVKNCNHKIRISLKIKNNEKSPTEVKFSYIKDVLDVKSGFNLSLLNPLVVRFRQEQVLLGYPVKYLTAVNGKASEKVINYENQKNFTGCDDESSINPTCGLQHQKGNIVEYSQGFCCFCPEAAATGKQARGRQDCSLTKPPSPEIDLTAYKASAHCLVKDKLWFTVNALDEPIILHQVFIQVYNLRHLRNSSSLWFALTGSEDFTIGPHNPFQYDGNKTIVMTYITAKPLEASITIPYKKSRLLVPQPLLNIPEENLPAISKNGPGDYLLIPKELIDSEGDTCDKAGVSYEGFSFQKDRCNSSQNSCLKNQPLEFWERDTETIKNGGKGSYLLKNFGTSYRDPIIVNKDTKEHWLALEYYKPHENFIYVETNADDIVPLTIGKHGVVLTVITESTTGFIYFYVDIENSGLASAEYGVQVTNCEYSVPDSGLQSEVIAPQRNSRFVVKTKPGNIQLTEKFSCTVELNTDLYKVIAKREAIIKPKGRCMCNFHCLCACLGESLTCEPMTEVEYHLAGFRGSLPVLTAKPPHKPWVVEHPLSALFAAILCLLLIGFIKGGIGLLKFPAIGEFGLYNLLYKPRKLDRYSDLVLEDVEVLYDEDGYPIHPDTKERLKLFSAQLLLVLNLFFCLVWPFQLCCDQLAKWRRDKSLSEDIENFSQSSKTTVLSDENALALFSITEHDSQIELNSEAVIDVTASVTPEGTELEEEKEEEEFEEEKEEEEFEDDDEIDPNQPTKFRKEVEKLNRIL